MFVHPINENGLKWIEMDLDFQKYWFTNVKMNAFQFWMHFYSFIGIAWSTSMPFNLKIILAFSAHPIHCEHFDSKFWIENAVFQSNCIQLNLIESNWIQLNPKKSICY